MKKISLIVAKLTILSFFMLMVAPVAMPVFSAAYAQSANVAPDPNANILVDTMCNVLRLVTGNAGKAFAAFAIISVGIGFFTGKVSWGLMIGVAAGIAAMFGAPTIVAAISGKSSFDCLN